MIANLVTISILSLGTANYVSTLFMPSMLASMYKLYLEKGIPFRENPFLSNKPILKEYDFVVIGAGPGGSVVANRLSEIPDLKVLLLEAGPADSIYADIPATVSFLQFSDINWGYKAEKTGSACLAAEDQRCPWPRGKVMGGTSTINYMIYTRGNKRDYDDYSAAGNTGWSYDEILPYFLKAEKNNIPEYRNSSYHNRNGYLNVERIPHKTILVDAFLKGGKELGYDIVDYNEPAMVGFSRIQSTMKKGRRVSASKAYIDPVKDRKNLHVSILSRVTKILIDPKTKVAYGVEFIKNGKKRTVIARKEVILSAGTLNSPQLLMLSGIGPREHLEELGIPVLQELRVGENLQEHYVTIGLTFLINVTNVSLKQSNLNIPSFIEWFRQGDGILTLPGGVEGLAYVNTKYNDVNSRFPDLELIFVAGSLASDGGLTVRRTFGITDSIYNRFFGSISLRDTWSIFPMILHPKTIGKVKLKSKDPKNAPLFYYNYFERDEDMKILIEGIRYALRLSETEAFRKIGTRLNPSILKECSQHKENSDEYWECFIRYFTGTIHHQCGTCKMGPSTDKTAVVDPQLRVYGIKNLRVIDASILPVIPGAHLYAPTVMVGEKGSDMIKSDWLNTGSK